MGPLSSAADRDVPAAGRMPRRRGPVRLPDGEEASGSLRRCLASGRRLPPEAMLRFVVDPEGRLVADFQRRLPGRGLWLAAEAAIVREAVAKKLFAKAARRPVEVAPDLPRQLAAAARERFLAQLGLARRAGALVAGFDQVRAALVQGQAALLIEAADGAPAGREKLSTAAGKGLAVIDRFTAAELGRALGRDIAVHLAVTDRRWAEGLSQRAALVCALDLGGAGEGNG